MWRRPPGSGRGSPVDAAARTVGLARSSAAGAAEGVAEEPGDLRPRRLGLQDALDEPEHRVLFFIDVVVGTLLHRMGMTGEPMVDADVDALVAMMLPHFARGVGPT